MEDPKPDDNRIEEIEEVYRTLGIHSEEIRKYLTSLGRLPVYKNEDERMIFIEASTTSMGFGAFTNA